MKKKQLKKRIEELEVKNKSFRGEIFAYREFVKVLQGENNQLKKGIHEYIEQSSTEDIKKMIHKQDQEYANKLKDYEKELYQSEVENLRKSLNRTLNENSNLQRRLFGDLSEEQSSTDIWKERFEKEEEMEETLSVINTLKKFDGNLRKMKKEGYFIDDQDINGNPV